MYTKNMCLVKREVFRPLLYPPLTKGRRGGVKEGIEGKLGFLLLTISIRYWYLGIQAREAFCL